MDIGLLLNAITTLAVVGGVVFGAWQIRVAARTRNTAVTLQLLQMLHNDHLTDGLVALMDAPGGLGEVELRKKLGDQWSKAFHAIIMLDGLGMLVHGGEVSTQLADGFFKHSIGVAWAKFGTAAVDMRREQSDNAFEWLQWLAEAQAKRGVRERLPAYSISNSSA